MSQTPFDFLNLFVRSPGDLIYFLAVVSISQAAFIMALGERLRQPQNRAASRYAVASIGLVLTWAVLMLGALYTLIAGQDIIAIFPPLERAANAIILLLVGWAFMTADHNRWGRAPNVILLLLMVLVIVGYVFTGIDWPGRNAQVDFNITPFGLAWTVVGLMIAGFMAALMVVYFRIITDAPLKLVFFAVLSIGHVGTLFQILQLTLAGNDPGPTRLAFVVALPILPVIIYRMVINHLQGELALSRSQPITIPPGSRIERDDTPQRGLPAERDVLLPKTGQPPGISPIQRDSIQLLKTLGLILEETKPQDIPQRIISAALEVLKADIGAILTIQDANYADISAAYDRVNARTISGIALNLDNQPTLVNAIERRLQRPLYVDRNVEELQDLYNRLDIDRTGPTYFQPLMSGKDLAGVLLVGMPHSGRELDESDRELLKGIGIISGNLLALSYAAQDARLKAEERAIQALVQGIRPEDGQDDAVAAARQELQSNLQQSREQIAELTRQITQLKIELDAERSRVASVVGDTEEGLSVSQRILALNEEHHQLREERDALARRLQEAETALAGATATSDDSVYKRLIESLRDEREELIAERDRLQAQIENTRATAEAQIISPQAIQDVAEQMGREKARLETERDQFRLRLADIESQLKALGIEDGPVGLAQLIAQLTEQRAHLQAKLDTLMLERNALLNERSQIEQNLQQEKEREARLLALQNEIKHLAADREALTKQRDQLRAERDELVARQDSVKQHRARLLAENSGYQLELAEANQEQAKLRVQVQALADEKSSLIALRDRLLAEKQALTYEREQLLARVEGNRERLQQLGEDGVGSLTTMIEEVTEQRNQLERQLNDANSQLAAAQHQIESLTRRASTSETPSTQPAGLPQPEVDLLVGTVQELRTPLTAIVGFVDLLLDESAGVLGEVQRKFLQKIASNVTRLTLMLNDLTHLTALDASRLRLSPQPVDIIGLIEDTISSATYQFREKSLTVNLQLEARVPEIHADQGAIAQIIGQLLTNAYLASPPESQIAVTAQRQLVHLSRGDDPTMPTECLLISVEDHGGGIAPDDIDRVFARRYKAANPLIQGLGDTGVGLSIARSLAEAHGGRLWVETQSGTGSIFYFALPINTILEAQNN